MRSSQAPGLGHLLESFFRQYLRSQRRASSATLASYRDTLRLLLLSASSRTRRQPCQLSVQDLDRRLILDFLDHLETERGDSIRTRNARLTAIRSFFRHVSYCDPTALGVAQRVLGIVGECTVRKAVRYLNRDQLQALLEAPTAARRDYALILFLAQTGARVSEATGVDVSDLRLEHPRQVLLGERGPRNVWYHLEKISPEFSFSLRKEPGPQQSDEVPVFVNDKGFRLTRIGVTHLLQRAVAITKDRHPELIQTKVSPHMLRHTTAMHLLQSGVDLITIQDWLGHAHVTTTHQYAEENASISSAITPVTLDPAPDSTARGRRPAPRVLPETR